MSGTLNIRDPNTGKFTPVTAIAGVGVPAKGTTGQILTKISDADYDTQWKENDASKLGGKAPEEYATAQEVSQLKNDLTAEQTARVEGLAEKLGKTETAADSAKLGGKAPEAYTQTEDVLSYEEIQASTDLTGKLPSAKALADGLIYCGAKLLWGHSSSSPQFKEGTLNVPGISDGKLFAFFTNSGSVCVGSRYMGIGGYLKYNSTSDAVIISYRYNGSGDNIIIDANNKGCYGSDGTQWAINQIYRLI